MTDIDRQLLILSKKSVRFEERTAKALEEIAKALVWIQRTAKKRDEEFQRESKRRRQHKAAANRAWRHRLKKIRQRRHERRMKRGARASGRKK